VTSCCWGWGGRAGGRGGSAQPKTITPHKDVGKKSKTKARNNKIKTTGRGHGGRAQRRGTQRELPLCSSFAVVIVLPSPTATRKQVEKHKTTKHKKIKAQSKKQRNKNIKTKKQKTEKHMSTILGTKKI
jgi:hypothetical protein